MNKSASMVINFNQPDIIDEDRLSSRTTDLLKAKDLGFSIPDGFIITSYAYQDFLSRNHLLKKIFDLISTIHYERPDSLMQVAKHIQTLVRNTKIQDELVEGVENEYKKWGEFLKNAEVGIGENEVKAKNLGEILKTIKNIWITKFEPQNLYFDFAHNQNSWNVCTAITVIKTLKTGQTGKILSATSEIITTAQLNKTQLEKLEKTAKVIKKHFYVPRVVSWAIDKDDLYIVRLIPVTNAQKSTLALVRHGESEWNAKGLWTGWADPPLSELGIKQAREAGVLLKDIHFDKAFTSALLRAIQTLDYIKKSKRQTIPTTSNKALNERDYGALTGKNKWEVEKEFGEKQFLKWRRGWDDPIPQGESLKDVYGRVVPYYKEHILPQIKAGKNVIIAAHGNSLRSLVKYIENISDEDIQKLEIPVGQIHLYQFDEDGNMLSKEIRNKQENKV